jgi:WD40 repeat protein
VLLHRGATHDIIQKVGDGKSGHGGAVWDVCFTIKGKAFITACADALIRIWQVGTGNVVRVLRGHTAAVSGVCFSPLDGRIVCRWPCL